MPTISLTDQFGLELDFSPAPASVFMKYARDIAEAKISLKDGQDIRAITVGSYPFASQEIGLRFEQGVPLGTSGAELMLTPEAEGSIQVGNGGDLLDGTLFDKPEARALFGQDYVSLGLKASIDAATSLPVGALDFGFDGKTQVVLTYCHPVSKSDKLVDALQAGFHKFTLPGTLEDLAAMEPASIASARSSGTLQFSGDLNVLAVTNPLATVATGIPSAGSLSLKEGASIGVTASLKFTGGYQVQVAKLGGSRVFLAFSRTRGDELDAAFTSEIGVSAAFGSYDVIKILLQAISADPAPPAEDLKNAGVDDAALDALASAIKASIQRSLQVALSAELGLSDEHANAFLYEIDLGALGSSGRQAVTDALRGNLTALEKSGLAGVQPLRSVLKSTRESTRQFNLNLLGVLNWGSVGDLLQNSTFIADPDTGDLAIIDKTVASGVDLSANNFAKKGEQLREIIADGFLSTCVYRASRTGFRSNLKSTCWAFNQNQHAGPNHLRDYLNIVVGLGLLTRTAADQKLAEVASVADFGRSTFYARSSYDDTLFQNLFFEGGTVRPLDFYVQAGRQAMAATLPPGEETNPARLIPLTRDDVWRSMLEGQTTFPTVLAPFGFNDVELNDITGDYSLIQWWAQAMHSLGQALAKLLAYLKANDVTDPNDAGFVELRKALDDKLAEVAEHTHDRFAQPFGLAAMDLASQQQSQTRAVLTTKRLSFSLARG